jgi:hypothetical protein
MLVVSAVALAPASAATPKLRLEFENRTELFPLNPGEAVEFFNFTHWTVTTAAGNLECAAENPLEGESSGLVGVDETNNRAKDRIAIERSGGGLRGEFCRGTFAPGEVDVSLENPKTILGALLLSTDGTATFKGTLGTDVALKGAGGSPTCLYELKRMSGPAKFLPSISATLSGEMKLAPASSALCPSKATLTLPLEQADVNSFGELFGLEGFIVQ